MRSQALWFIERVKTWTLEGPIDGAFVDLRHADEPASHSKGYSSGGRGISHEDAAALAEFLDVETLEQAAGRGFWAPASVKSYEDVLKLMVERARARKQIPSGPATPARWAGVSSEEESMNPDHERWLTEMALDARPSPIVLRRRERQAVARVIGAYFGRPLRGFASKHCSPRPGTPPGGRAGG